MPFFPQQSSDIFDISQNFGLSPQRANGFQADTVPSSSGLGTRTGALSSGLVGVNTRKMVHWLVPDGPIVQMYINPQSIVTTNTKNVDAVRTKGGFTIQYWGEALIVINITGTTGTSGIEGINVLYDVYRNEQLAFDPFALFLAAKNKQDTYSGDIFGSESIFNSSDNFLNSLFGAAQDATQATAQQAPSLAALASQVEMYWSGEVYRGFFNNFVVTEAAINTGMFDYTIQFTAVQKRGIRRNFLAWHRSATNGPSNSSEFGPPHTFSNSITGTVVPQRIPTQTPVEAFESVGSSLTALGNRFRNL
jgi:hypothetical protein